MDPNRRSYAISVQSRWSVGGRPVRGTSLSGLSRESTTTRVGVRSPGPGSFLPDTGTAWGWGRPKLWVLPDPTRPTRDPLPTPSLTGESRAVPPRLRAGVGSQ